MRLFDRVLYALQFVLIIDPLDLYDIRNPVGMGSSGMVVVDPTGSVHGGITKMHGG
jgi:hypothetical protein